MPRRKGMVNWYDTPRLASTAVRVAISTVFGEFADRREGMAVAREIDPAALDPVYDYSKTEEDFWLDFVADTGDGWNPTYAIARLLAAQKLEPAGSSEPLPRGRVLVMGGDQVYPTASRLDYHVRLLAPFDEAAKGAWSRDKRPDVFAIPGNHDWYDGLSAFMGLFCARRAGLGQPAPRGRVVGGRQTQQTRSYFALKLPGMHWLWGIDIQLSGYVDQPQVAFFDHVARRWMDKGSRLILCASDPIWASADAAQEGSPESGRFKNFTYMESVAARARRDHRVVLILAGDSHHYARYVEGDRHYVTAGGGGAFLHPTHQLPDETRILSKYPPPGEKPAVDDDDARYERRFTLADGALFPDRVTSRRLSLSDLAFAWKNWQFTATMMAATAFFTWLLAGNAAVLGSDLRGFLSSAMEQGLCAALLAYLKLALVTPWPVLAAAAAIGGFYYFSDYRGFGTRLATGLAHGGAHALALIAVTLLLSQRVESTLALLILTGIVAGILSATLFGVYLLISLNVFGRHWNEAFSALRIENYKCFVRLRFRRDGGLTLYPIGLKHIPADDKSEPPGNPALSPHLIEQPIEFGGKPD